MKNERLLLFVLAGIQFTTIMDFMIMMPLGPQFKRIFQMGPELWSSVISSYTFAAAFSGLLAIFFLDFVDRRKALLFLYAGFIAATCMVGFADTVEFLLFSRALTGVFGGIIGALILAIVGDLIPNERRGRAVGIVMTGFSAAASLGVPLGLLLGTNFGWHVAFFMIAGISLILLGFTYRLVPSIIPQREKIGSLAAQSWSGIRNVFTDANQLKALLFMMLIIFGQFAVIPFISPYMVANVGFAEVQLTYIYLAGGILTVFTSPLVGKLSDKYGRQRTFLVMMLVSLIPIYAITNMGGSPIWVVLIFSSMFFIFAAGRMIPASAIVIGTAHPNYRGTFMSVRSAVVSLGQGVAAYTAGMIIIETPSGLFERYDWIGYLSLATSILSYFLLRKIKDRY